MSEVDRRILDDAPSDSELHRWETDGQRRDYSNIVSWVDPDERYLLEVTVDDPVQGYLIRLFRLTGYAEPRSSESRIAQAVTDKKRVDALERAAEMAAAADELDAVDENPTTGPAYPDMEMVDHPDYSLPAPDEWAELEDEWNEKVQDALEKADDTRGRPALSRKEIDGSAYYYLQWRHGDSVETQYLAPVEP
jgi:hypothetical protein